MHRRAPKSGPKSESVRDAISSRSAALSSSLASAAASRRRGLLAGDDSPSGPLLSLDGASLLSVASALSGADGIVRAGVRRSLRVALRAADSAPPADDPLRSVVRALGALVAAAPADEAADAAAALADVAFGAHALAHVVVAEAGHALLSAVARGCHDDSDGAGAFTVAAAALFAIAAAAVESADARAGLLSLGSPVPILAALAVRPLAGGAARAITAQVERAAATPWVTAGANVCLAAGINATLSRGGAGESGQHNAVEGGAGVDASALEDDARSLVAALAALCSQEVEAASVIAEDGVSLGALVAAVGAGGLPAPAAALAIAALCERSHAAAAALANGWSVAVARAPALASPPTTLAAPVTAIVRTICSADLYVALAFLKAGGGAPAVVAELNTRLRATAHAVRREALGALAALATRTAPLPDTVGGGFTLPLLSLVIDRAPDALRAAASALEALDVDAARAGLLLIDATLSAWRPRVPPPDGLRLIDEPVIHAAAAAVLGPDNAALLDIGTFLRVRGTALVEESDGIAALEALALRSDAPSALSDWAAHLVDKYFGADAPIEDADDVDDE